MTRCATASPCVPIESGRLSRGELPEARTEKWRLRCACDCRNKRRAAALAQPAPPPCPLCADCVEKSPTGRCGDEICNKRIEAGQFLNHCCVSGLDLESIFRAWRRK